MRRKIECERPGQGLYEKIREYIIDAAEIVKENEPRSGQFGVVYKAKWSGNVVAEKSKGNKYLVST